VLALAPGRQGHASRRRAVDAKTSCRLRKQAVVRRKSMRKRLAQVVQQMPAVSDLSRCVCCRIDLAPVTTHDLCGGNNHRHRRISSSGAESQPADPAMAGCPACVGSGCALGAKPFNMPAERAKARQVRICIWIAPSLAGKADRGHFRYVREKDPCLISRCRGHPSSLCFTSPDTGREESPYVCAKNHFDLPATSNVRAQ
jgi:hypothetical protein